MIDSISYFLGSAYNSKFFFFIQAVVALYCLILFFNIVYTSIQLSLFRNRARQFFLGTPTKSEQYGLVEELPGTIQILEINKKTFSKSPSDWKIAIIEADKMLDKTLEKKGFQGVSLGEKLKQMVPADLPELYEEVWKAHKVRNLIVHEPEFEISQSETRRIVGIYEKVLKKMTQ